MRKFYLGIASCVALVAFMGFSASAFANHLYDSDCAADPDAFEMSNFTIDTPDSNIEYYVSGVTGSGRACGSRIHGLGLGDFQGTETLNDIAVIQYPPGVEVNQAPSAKLLRGRYIGEARVDALTWIWFFGGAVPVDNSELTLRVEDRDDPITPPGGSWGSPDCPANSLACYRGKSDTGHGWMWVLEDADGGLSLTIGRFYNDVTGAPAGLTEIDYFSLCGYAGDVNGISCGESWRGRWLQTNGVSSLRAHPQDSICGERPGIPEGAGTYTATVTNRAGQTTDPVRTWVRWDIEPIAPTGSGIGHGVLSGPSHPKIIRSREMVQVDDEDQCLYLWE